MIGDAVRAFLAPIVTNIKLVAAVVVGALGMYLVMTAYDAFIDDPAVREALTLKIRAQEIADANKRITEMMENNDEFSSMSECARFNELAAPSGLPLRDCER